ncbi:hypothetical protein D9601_07690 [Sphingomonas sp. MA1305]|nr:hypothetical protein [Sphingomonas sp. MA1305]
MTGLRTACALLFACDPTMLTAQALPASPASSTEKPGKPDTAPEKDPNGLILTASSRLRFEGVAGRPRPGSATAEDAVLLRTGIAVEYGPGPLAIGAEMIDSRGYALARTTQISNSEVNAVELPQAYLKLRLDDLLGRGRHMTLDAGRFLINLGSGRLVATDEYGNTVNGFTGIRSDLEPDRQTVLTLFYVLPQQKLPDDPTRVRRNAVVMDRETFDRVLIGGHVRRKALIAGSTLEITYLRLAEHDAPGFATADRRLHTLDGRLSRESKAGKLDGDAEVAYQFGDASASTEASARHADVSATLVHAAAGYTWATPIQPRLGLFYDYASGNGRDARTIRRFDSLYGSRRDDFGPSGTYGAISRENMSAPGVRFEAKPGKRVEALADYRAIWLASRYDRFFGVTDATGRSGRFAGQQVEGRIRYWLIPDHLRLESNAAVLFKGPFLRDAPAALARDQATVRFLEINLQATF